MSFEQIPQERKDIYLANAEQAVREATDPVVAKLGESAVQTAEDILRTNEEHHSPIAQAETILMADEPDKGSLRAEFENSGFIDNKGYRALAGNYSNLEPTTQNRLFDAGFIDGEGQTLRVPDRDIPEDVTQLADALKASSDPSEQIAAKTLERAAQQQVEMEATPVTPEAIASLDKMFGQTEAPNVLSDTEQAKLAELDTTEQDR